MAVQQIRAQVNGTWYTLTLNGVTGQYTKTINAPNKTSYNMDGGYYPVAIEASDDSGNVATDASGRLFVRETTAPVVTITSPTSGAYLDYTQPVVRFTLRDEVDGSGVKLDTLALTVDGDPLGSTAPGMVCTAATGGFDCTYTPPVALVDGEHTITATVQDNDGNTAAEAKVTITIDTVPPTLDITSPSDGFKTNTDTVTVSGVTNDATSKPVTITITVGGTDQGAVTVDSSGNFSKEVPVALGDNTIVVRATDRAGKQTEITRAVYINKTAPVISNISATPNPVTAGDTVVISVTVVDA